MAIYFFLNYKSKDIKIDTSTPLSQEEIIEKKVDEKFERLEESHSGRYTQDELEFEELDSMFKGMVSKTEIEANGYYNIIKSN